MGDGDFLMPLQQRGTEVSAPCPEEMGATCSAPSSVPRTCPAADRDQHSPRRSQTLSGCAQDLGTLVPKATAQRPNSSLSPRSRSQVRTSQILLGIEDGKACPCCTAKQRRQHREWAQEMLSLEIRPLTNQS